MDAKLNTRDRQPVKRRDVAVEALEGRCLLSAAPAPAISAGDGTVNSLPHHIHLAAHAFQNSAGVQLTAKLAAPQSVSAASVQVDWGDGSLIQNVSLVKISAKRWKTNVSHVYAGAGEFTVHISALAGGTVEKTISKIVHVQQAPSQSGDGTGGVYLHAVPGKMLNATIGSVSAPFSSEGDAITIDWGDGSESAAQAIDEGNHFDIVGTHTYHKSGKYTINVFASAAPPLPLEFELFKSVVTVR